ncbi:hypothetical protein DEO72_LG10g661 [Vigna unguiculata]|uniref:PROP1-like PPR domain-containing protein n=1 Tax=Vigna unguiculata TaxID=3917 RepID=A0A4D6N967_VIGUN|nr:hypothetical protein DEO72_LG10g661 [Vigna unguiculata]
MSALGVVPNEATVTAVARLAAAKGDEMCIRDRYQTGSNSVADHSLTTTALDYGFRAFRHMSALGVVPNEATVTAVARLAAAKGDEMCIRDRYQTGSNSVADHSLTTTALDYGFRAFRHMSALGVVPNEATVTAVARLAAAKGDEMCIRDRYQTGSNSVADHSLTTTALDYGFRAFRHMSALGVVPNEATVTAVARLAAAKGDEMCIRDRYQTGSNSVADHSLTTTALDYGFRAFRHMSALGVVPNEATVTAVARLAAAKGDEMCIRDRYQTGSNSVADHSLTTTALDYGFRAFRHMSALGVVPNEATVTAVARLAAAKGDEMCIRDSPEAANLRSRVVLFL